MKLVALSHHNPRTIVVKPKMPLHSKWDFNCRTRDTGRTMCDRQNGNESRPIIRPVDRKHNHAGTVFPPFLLPGPIFPMPQICIGNDKTRLRDRDSHTARYSESISASRCA